MKLTASSEKFLEEVMPGVKVPPGHWAIGQKEVKRHGRVYPEFNGISVETNLRPTVPGRG